MMNTLACVELSSDKCIFATSFMLLLFFNFSFFYAASSCSFNLRFLSCCFCLCMCMCVHAYPKALTPSLLDISALSTYFFSGARAAKASCDQRLADTTLLLATSDVERQQLRATVRACLLLYAMRSIWKESTSLGSNAVRKLREGSDMDL